MSHTPGPWTMTPREDADSYVHDDITAEGGKRIANVFGDLSQEPWKSNARLIAAAPDLLAALQSLMKAYGHPITGENGNSGECWDLARAAVAKATPATAAKGATL